MGEAITNNWKELSTGSAGVLFENNLIIINDNVSNGMASLELNLTKDDIDEIFEHWMSFHCKIKLDKNSGTSGFFWGFGVDGNNNPNGKGQQRYRVSFMKSSGDNDLRLSYSGNTSVINQNYWKWFNFEVHIPPNFANGEIYVDDKFIDFVSIGSSNVGSDNKIHLSSGSMGGNNRISYIENINVIIYKELSLDLSEEEFDYEEVVIYIRKGAEDYVVSIPENIKKELGHKLTLICDNVNGSVQLNDCIIDSGNNKTFDISH